MTFSMMNLNGNSALRSAGLALVSASCVMRRSRGRCQKRVPEDGEPQDGPKKVPEDQPQQVPQEEPEAETTEVVPKAH